MSSGLETAVLFAGSLPGVLLMMLGQAVVVVCVCSEMVRVLSVPGSRRRYLASTVFMTLALPSILISMIRVLIHAASGAWPEAAIGVFVLVAVIFRWRHDPDEDNWWKGKGKQLGRWLRGRAASCSLTAPAPS
jgi:TRAP-type C4-dicarboxylate transport system permease large subunit